LDIYSTNEPQQIFHQRINFCLDLHNESVQALRFPNSSIQKDLKKVAELAEEERDVAAKIQNNELDDDDEDMM
jgi:26S proteasome regulatory subunit N3